jgi:hypothetical protein
VFLRREAGGGGRGGGRRSLLLLFASGDFSVTVVERVLSRGDPLCAGAPFCTSGDFSITVVERVLSRGDPLCAGGTVCTDALLSPGDVGAPFCAGGSAVADALREEVGEPGACVGWDSEDWGWNPRTELKVRRESSRGASGATTLVELKPLRNSSFDIPGGTALLVVRDTATLARYPGDFGEDVGEPPFAFASGWNDLSISNNLRRMPSSSFAYSARSLCVFFESFFSSAGSSSNFFSTASFAARRLSISSPFPPPSPSLASLPWLPELVVKLLLPLFSLLVRIDAL